MQKLIYFSYYPPCDNTTAITLKVKKIKSVRSPLNSRRASSNLPALIKEEIGGKGSISR